MKRSPPQPQILNKIETIEDKTIISAIANTAKTTIKTLKQGIDILEQSENDPKVKERWKEIEKGKKTIKQIHNELTGKGKVKPIKESCSI